LQTGFWGGGTGRIDLVFSEHELTFTFAICYRHMSVTLMHPTQALEIFGNISYAFGILAIRWHPQKILWRSSQGNPSVREVKHNKSSQTQRFWTYQRLYLGNGARLEVS